MGLNINSTNPRSYQEIANENLKILYDCGISKLYHMTDTSNLPSINKSGGLLSLKEQLQKGVTANRPGGNRLSRKLALGLDRTDYVSLTWNRNHPMFSAVVKQRRLPSPVLIEIDLRVVRLPGVRYSFDNATKQVHLWTVLTDTQMKELTHRQSEVLIPKKVPSKLFLKKLAVTHM